MHCLARFISQLLLVHLAVGGGTRRPQDVVGHLRSDRLRELEDYDPVASLGAQVVVGPYLRISVLSERVVRIEEPMDAAQFEDRATLAVVQRKFVPPKFSVKREGGKLHLRTKFLHLEVDVDEAGAGSGTGTDRATEGEIRVGSIQISAVAPAGSDEAFRTWRVGEDGSQGNLLGTIRTLDSLGPLDLNCSQVPLLNSGESLHCRYGMVSTNGWAVLNDTANPCLNPVTTWWESGVRRSRQDLYFFGFGRRYKDAIKEYVKISGKPPMLPRSALGVWWTRWFNYDQHELMEIYQEMANRRIPLDMLVLDMNWHRKPSWGGYSWDRTLFPFPQVAFTGFKDDGIPLMVNVHDDSGVSSREETFASFESYLKMEDKRRFKFASCNNSLYAFGLEDIVLENLRLGGNGVDYFWIDWQQGGDRGGCRGNEMNPTIWLNRIRSTRSRRLGYTRRDLILARWGGYGSHRYPVGFSGDVDKVTWSRLAYQPYFTVTASNVAYGYWSHDITGPLDDPELTVRWIQWAVFSPIIRFHERGLSAGECSLAFPDEVVSSCAMAYIWQLSHKYYALARDALELRLQLLPYMYNLMREYHETGISPVRPMYYDYPGYKMAYATDRFGNFSQFLLGENVLVAPVVRPSSPANGYMASKKTWLPPGCWSEQSSNRVVIGPKVLSSSYLLDEIPVWTRCGAIIPMLHTRRSPTVQGIASRAYEHLTLQVHLHSTARTGEVEVYQDDGETLGYLNNNVEQLKLAYEYSGAKVALKLSNAFVTDELKSVTISLINSGPLGKVTCSTACKVSYDALNLVARIEIHRNPHKEITVTSEGVQLVDQLVKGKVAALRRIKKTLDHVRAAKMLPALNTAATAFLHWEAHARAGDLNGFMQAVSNFTQIDFPRARDSLLNLHNVWVVPERQAYIRKLLARVDGAVVTEDAYSIMMKS